MNREWDPVRNPMLQEQHMLPKGDNVSGSAVGTRDFRELLAGR